MMHKEQEGAPILRILLFLICFLLCSAEASRTHKPQTLRGFDIPVLKVMRRQIRGFMSHKNPTVTIIFKASMPVHIRWFRLAPSRNLPRSEVPHMLPVHGDPKFRVSSVRAGQVQASTLHVIRKPPGFTRRQPLRFPQEFEIIITSKNQSMQYQLTTIIKHPTNHKLTDIDAPEWMAIPPKEMYFRGMSTFRIHCEVLVPQEDHFTNALNMHHAIVQSTTGNPQVGNVDLQLVITSTKDQPHPHAEDWDNYEVKADRKLAKANYVVYEVKLRTMNATRKDEGMYRCALERLRDKSIVTSAVTLYSRKSPLPSKPLVNMISCEAGNFNQNSKILILTQGQPTCIRCQGVGFPHPHVALYRAKDGGLNEEEVRNGVDTTVTRFSNIADVRTAEAMYTFRRPNDPGRYLCKAKNAHDEAKMYFRILLKPK